MGKCWRLGKFLTGRQTEYRIRYRYANQVLMLMEGSVLILPPWDGCLLPSLIDVRDMLYRELNASMVKSCSNINLRAKQ
jgi:hypothetical protein